MSKKRTNISLDPNVYTQAKELGINISQTSEQALQIRIKSTHTGPTSDGTPAPLGLALAQTDAPVPDGPATRHLDADEFLNEFEQTCRVDWALAERTAEERVRYATKLVDHLGDHPLTATKQELRAFITQYNDDNATKTVRAIYRQYFDTDIADSFTVTPSPPTPTKSPKKAELQQVYRELTIPEMQVAFLLLATSGLRRRELMELTPADFDLANKAIYPSTRDGHTTKRQWMTFYSPDAETRLHDVFDIQAMGADERLFTCYPDTLTNRIRRASEAADVMKITPQTLRIWFCNEMGRLGVADRYIDAFCGRTASSVLAKHYSDYTPRKLQEVYEDAGISVLAGECT